MKAVSTGSLVGQALCKTKRLYAKKKKKLDAKSNNSKQMMMRMFKQQYHPFNTNVWNTALLQDNGLPPHTAIVSEGSSLGYPKRVIAYNSRPRVSSYILISGERVDDP